MTPIDTPFVPHPLLRNKHLMTILPALTYADAGSLNRRADQRLVTVAPDAQVLLHCHLTPGSTAPCVIALHGLEGSSSSVYVTGLTHKALSLGFQVVRMNMRNCGGTMHLSSTLYNAGLSNDVIVVVKEIQKMIPGAPIFLIGYSLGGNVVLKAAAELASAATGLLSGVCAISPSLDLSVCVRAIGTGINRLYEQRFLIGLKLKVQKKNKLFPNRYDLAALKRVKTLHDFDETYTAPDGGYHSADDYYERASALPIIDRIEVPTLIIASKDDPIVPFQSFTSNKLSRSNITLLAPNYGGHGGFLLNEREPQAKGRADRRWAENRALQFCLHHI